MRAWWVLWFVACSSAPPPAPVTSAPPPSDAALAPDAAVVVAPDAAVALAGAATKIKERETVTIAKTAIEFSGASHKHAVKGPSVGMWYFRATRDGKTEEIELRSSDDRFEAEVVAHGLFFLFRHVSYTEFEIVLGAETAPAPLDQDACVERIRAAATKASLSVGPESGYSTSQGIVWFKAKGWTGYCGTLSRRVWFARS